MRYTILFIIALILVSGFIAYFGDLLGRRMGKKRLTLWTLRPRHTAIIVTTITGMLISTLALFALVSVNSQFRKVLTRGEVILAQNEQLSRANIGLERTNKRLSAQGARLQAQVDAARKDVRTAVAARDKAVAEVSKLEKEIRARQAELVQLRAKAQSAERELSTRTRELAQVRKQLGTAQTGLADAQARLMQAESSVQDARAKLAASQKDLAARQEEVKTAVDQLTRAKGELQQAQTQLATTEAQLAQRQQELKELAQMAEAYAKEFPPALRGRDFAFRQGDELARGIISPRQSDFGIRGEIYYLLESASKLAVDREAKVGDNNRAVSLIFRQTLENGVLAVNNEEECVKLASAAIARSPQDAVVQVVCARNSLPGEQVPVELLLNVNFLVYRKGDLIAETKINGGMSEGRILIRLIDFLQTDVSEAAVKAGLVPVAKPESRDRTEQNPQEVDEQIAVVERIKTMNGPARVAVYATADVRAGDSLNISNMRFSVLKIESK